MFEIESVIELRKRQIKVNRISRSICGAVAGIGALTIFCSASTSDYLTEIGKVDTPNVYILAIVGLLMLATGVAGYNVFDHNLERLTNNLNKLRRTKREWGIKHCIVTGKQIGRAHV